MGYMSGKPNSNERPQPNGINKWGSQNPDFDDFAVLINKLGKHCTGCHFVILNEHLKYKNGKPYCPDCIKKAT
jgi:hypothetical protein